MVKDKTNSLLPISERARFLTPRERERARYLDNRLRLGIRLVRETLNPDEIRELRGLRKIQEEERSNHYLTGKKPKGTVKECNEERLICQYYDQLEKTKKGRELASLDANNQATNSLLEINKEGAESNVVIDTVIGDYIVPELRDNQGAVRDYLQEPAIEDVNNVLHVVNDNPLLNRDSQVLTQVIDLDSACKDKNSKIQGQLLGLTDIELSTKVSLAEKDRTIARQQAYIERIKHVILAVFDKNRFAKWTRSNQTEYYNMLQRLMPKELNINETSRQITIHVTKSYQSDNLAKPVLTQYSKNIDKSISVTALAGQIQDNNNE